MKQIDVLRLCLDESGGDITAGLTAFQFITENRIDVSLLNGIEKPKPPAINAFFAHDISNQRAQEILNRSLKEARNLSADARKDLANALSVGRTDNGVALVEFINKYRVQLANLLTVSQLAAVLEGAREVATKVPALESDLSELGDIPQPKFPIEESVHLTTIDNATKDLAERNVITRSGYDALDHQARTKAFTVAGVNAEETLTKIRDTLADNVSKGTDYEAFKQEILSAVDEGTFLSDSHLETVFRSNVQSAFSEGQLAILQNPLVQSGFPYAAYDSIHDDRARPEHNALDNLGIGGSNVYRMDDPVFQTFRPPWDYCLPGDSLINTKRGRIRVDTVVDGDEVLTHKGRFQRVFDTHRTEGITELVAIELKSGAFCRTTGEHRILTDRGWINAADMNVGDKVHQIVDATTPYLVMLKVDQSFETESLTNTSISISIRPSGIFLNFNTDSNDGKVEIKPKWKGLLIENKLDTSVESALLKSGGKSLFVTSHTNDSIDMFGRIEFDRLSPSGDHLSANFGSARNAMDSICGGNFINPFWVETIRHFTSITSRSSLDISRCEDSSNSAKCDTSNPSEIADTDFFLKIVPDSGVESARVAGETCLGLIEVGSRAFWLFSHNYNCTISTGVVKAVHRLPWSSPVYNFGVEEDHSYIADGIVVHNCCRCSWTPLTLDQAAEKGIAEAIEWDKTGVEPANPAYVPMPQFQPPEGFQRAISSAPLSIQLSMRPMNQYCDDKYGCSSIGMMECPSQATVIPITADEYPRNKANQFLEKYLIADAANNPVLTDTLRESIPEEERPKLDRLIALLQADGAIYHPKESPGLAIDINGRIVDPEWQEYAWQVEDYNRWKERDDDRQERRESAILLTEMVREQKILRKLTKALNAAFSNDFDESKHPRADDGTFGKGSGNRELIGQGKHGKVYKVGDTSVKETNQAEKNAYTALSGVNGVAPAKVTSEGIEYPHYKNILSIDTIPEKQRKNLSSIISKNVATINQTITEMSDRGIKYSDPLQFGVNQNKTMDLIDFSNSQKTSQEEALADNIDQLTLFYTQFGMPEVSTGVRTAYNLLQYANDPDSASFEEDYIQDAVANLRKRIGDTKVSNVYITRNARSVGIKGADESGVVDGWNVVVSEHPISTEEMGKWELTPVIHRSSKTASLSIASEKSITEVRSDIETPLEEYYSFLKEVINVSKDAIDNADIRALERMRNTIETKLLYKLDAYISQYKKATRADATEIEAERLSDRLDEFLKEVMTCSIDFSDLVENAVEARLKRIDEECECDEEPEIPIEPTSDSPIAMSIEEDDERNQLIAEILTMLFDDEDKARQAAEKIVSSQNNIMLAVGAPKVTKRYGKQPGPGWTSGGVSRTGTPIWLWGANTTGGVSQPAPTPQPAAPTPPQTTAKTPSANALKHRQRTANATVEYNKAMATLNSGGTLSAQDKAILTPQLSVLTVTQLRSLHAALGGSASVTGSQRTPWTASIKSILNGTPNAAATPAPVTPPVTPTPTPQPAATPVAPKPLKFAQPPLGAKTTPQGNAKHPPVPYAEETTWETGTPKQQSLNGINFAPAPPKFWEKTKDVDIKEPKPLKKIDRVSVMIQEPDGRIWIVEPTNEFGNRKYTMPGGGVEKGLTDQQNALKEIWEETGLQVEITGFAGDFEDSNNGNNGRLYIGKRIGGAPWDAKIESFIISKKTGKAAAESERVSLVTPEKAAKLLHRTDDLAQLAIVKPIPIDMPVKGSGSETLKKLVAALAPEARAYDAKQAAAGVKYGAGNGELYAARKVRGFDKTPNLVSKKDMDAKIASGDYIEMLRGIKDVHPSGGAVIKASDLAEEYRTGNDFPGHGIFGSGTYADSTSGYTNVASSYAGYSGSGALLRMALPKTAKIITESELEKKVPNAPAAFAGYQNSGGKQSYECWMGVQATLAGYDAIQCTGNSSRHGSYGKGFYVILNRGIMVVQKEDAKGHQIK